MASLQQRSGGSGSSDLGNEGLISALIAFQRKAVAIHKDSTGQHSDYASLHAVLSAIGPALSDCGLAITQAFSVSDPQSTVLSTTLHHISGETLTSSTPLLDLAGKNPLHVWGAAVTYQRRYAILALLGLAAGIKDDDGRTAIARLNRTTSTSPDDIF